MILRINALEVENFKGVKKASYEFGDETHFFGKNATGKTTIADAFFWLLFDRDSKGNTPGSDRFREKPIDENGQECHNLDTIVVAKCTLDGNPFVLKRVQRENWVTKRGSKDAVYQGNNSTYWINDVETKATEYKSRINGIANGELFSLVARLGAFNALDEKSRRTILIDMVGMDVDQELLAKEEYASIAEEARNRGVGIDELKKVMGDQRKKINQEMNLIPAKIDEVKRMLPNFTDQDVKDAERNIKETEADIQRCRTEIAAFEAGDEISRLARGELITAQGKLIAIKQGVIADYETQRKRLENDIQMARKRKEMEDKALTSAKMQQAKAQAEKDNIEEKLEKTRSEYRQKYQEVFVEGEKPDRCELCGQPITDELWASTVEDRRNRFETIKKQSLALISDDGKTLKISFEMAEGALAQANEALEKAQAESDEANNVLQTAEDALNRYPLGPNFDTEEIKTLESKISELKTRSNSSVESLMKGPRDEIERLQERQNRAKEILAKVAQKAELDARLEELTKEQAEFGAKKADIELVIFKIDQFVSERCAMLEQGINDKFSTVKWKLFNQQINGAIVDCCECMVPGEGVLMPYSGTNTAARINADIEIIDALSKYFDIVAPVFVDNAECVNYISKPKGQLITMSVSTDEVMRCEITNKEDK